MSLFACNPEKVILLGSCTDFLKAQTLLGKKTNSCEWARIISVFTMFLSSSILPLKAYLMHSRLLERHIPLFYGNTKPMLLLFSLPKPTFLKCYVDVKLSIWTVCCEADFQFN